MKALAYDAIRAMMPVVATSRTILEKIFYYFMFYRNCEKNEVGRIKNQNPNLGSCDLKRMVWALVIGSFEK